MGTSTIDPETGRSINLHGSHGVRETLLLLHKREDGCAVTLMHFSAGAVLGMHPAGWGQLFLVLDGAGWVREADGPKRPVRRGSATFWASGEIHETGTESGMNVLVIESPESHDASVIGRMLRGRKEAR